MKYQDKWQDTCYPVCKEEEVVAEEEGGDEEEGGRPGAACS